MAKTTYVGPKPHFTKAQHLTISENYEHIARIRGRVAEFFLECQTPDSILQAELGRAATLRAAKCLGDESERLVREALADRKNACFHQRLAALAKS